MLEKVTTPIKYENHNLIRFKDIQPLSSGTGLCYVRSASHKYSKSGKPYLTLYICDVDNVVIPAYIFDVVDLKQVGLDIKEMIGSIVSIDWVENYLKGTGLTLIIEKLDLVKNPNMDLLSKYAGKTDNIDSMLEHIYSRCIEVFGNKVQIPFFAQTHSNIDYDNGKIGGLVKYYYQIFNALDTIQITFPEEDFKTLYGTAILYIISHLRYIEAETNNKADVNLIVAITGAIQRSIDKLPVSKGILEVVMVNFGLEPTDIFVRTVHHIAKTIMCINKEVSTYNSLPISEDGNAGYGIIHRYS